MRKAFMNEPSEIHISAMDLETANLSEWEGLELHLLNQAAVVIPGVMNVMEVIRTAVALQGLASDLLSAIGTACEKCDECGVELFCDLLRGEIRSDVCIPPQVLEKADIDPDTKLDCEVDSESGKIHIVEADYRYDLLDIPRSLLGAFRECGICLSDLEEKLKAEEIVYRTNMNKSFSD